LSYGRALVISVANAAERYEQSRVSSCWQGRADHVLFAPTGRLRRHIASNDSGPPPKKISAKAIAPRAMGN